MKLKDLYKAIIEIGIQNDPRGKNGVEKALKQVKDSYTKLAPLEKNYFDTEKLTNPYSDSRIYHGTGNEEIKTIMVGVDMETPELLVADRLRERGEKIDAVMTHHPEGTALLSLAEVMSMQADIMHSFGVPINIADGVLSNRIREVSEGVLPVNYYRAVRAAEMLKIPYFGAHTPADNCVVTYLQKIFDKNKPETVGNVFDILMNIEEYKISLKHNNGPRIVSGSKIKRAGKVYVDMTGGTGGSIDMLDRLANSGVGTMICMHMSKDHLERAKKCLLNVVIAGHMASDSLGLNLLLDSAQKKIGKLKIIEFSGFTRVERFNKK
ncbi:MAG: NGG1p interacting factor NIF3 [Elusimicrobiota bacterium]